MQRWINRFEWRTVTGAPVSAHGVTVTPEARALIIAGPYGGLVWNRPVGVRVEWNGTTRRLPIFNLTRVAQVGILGAGVAVSMLLRPHRAPRTREEHRP